MTIRRLAAVSLLLFPCAGFSAPAAPLYRETFDAGTVAWTAAGPADRGPRGRTGDALRISTYPSGGEACRWESPPVKAGAGPLTVSCWMAHNLAYTQDPGYGAVLAAVFLDGTGAELRRDELAKTWRPPYRDLYDYVAIPEAGGLAWQYREAVVAPPAGAAAMRLVFAWSDFTSPWRQTRDHIKGEVWLDDVLVTAGGALQPPAPPQPAKTLPYRLRINTPVETNVFLVSEPLEFTVRLDGPDGPPTIRPGAVLEYRVEDFQRLKVASGTVPLSLPYYYWGTDDDQKKRSLLKHFYLPEAVRTETGRWMAIVVSLTSKGEVLARGETAFAVTAPRVLTVDEAARARFYGSGRAVRSPENGPWGIVPRYDEMERQGAFGVRSHGWDLDWKRRQPTKDSPVSFAADFDGADYPMHTASRRTFSFEERNPLREHWLHYTQLPSAVPGWALVPGRAVRDGDFVDPDAYARYTAEYVRHTSALYYYVTAPEGGGIEKFANMARAAYAAVKSVDPRIQVVAQVDYLRGAEYAKELCDKGLLDSVDILVFDTYSSRLNEKVREFRSYCERRGIWKKYWVQEYCYTGSLDQEERTRRTVDFCVWALANGVDKLRWYGNEFETDGIRDPLPASGCVYAERGMIRGQGEKLSVSMTEVPPLSHTFGYAKGNHIPYLQWLVYHQLVSHFATADFREFLVWGPGVEGALFDDGTRSTAAAWRPTASPSIAVTADSGGVPYTLTDMYGRRVRMVPYGGKTILSVGQDPVFFDFDARPGRFAAVPAAVAIEAPGPLPPGAASPVRVRFRNDFGKPLAAEMTLSVDETWRIEPAVVPVTLAAGASQEFVFSVSPPADAEPGDRPALLRAATAAGTAVCVRETIEVAAPLALSITETPFTGRAPAAVSLSLANRTGKPVSGIVSLAGDFGSGDRPEKIEREISAPPGGTGTVRIAFPGWTPSMSRDYTASAVFRGSGGERLAAVREVSFRAVPQRTRKVSIDGDPADWDLPSMVPFDFFRVHSLGGSWMSPSAFARDKVRWKGPADASARFYVQWDAERLYFLFLVRDDSFKPGGKGVGIWSHDAIHFLLYPWGVQPGDVIRGLAYKEHIGLDQDGLATYDRIQGTVGNWAIGSGRPQGVEIAIRKTADGVVEEFSVPFAQFAPLEAKAGSRFSLSLLYCDDDSDGVSWYYAQTNVDINPAAFGVFTLAE